MIQQVNLFLPMFRKQEKVFSAKALLQSCAVVAAGLLLVYSYALWQVLGQRTELNALQKQHDSTVARLATLTSKFPPKRKSQQLEAAVQRLSKERDAKQRLVQELTTRDFGNTRGFSQHLAGLARQRVSGMWLTGISLSDGGAQIGLSGSTYRPDLLPQYLNKLAGEEVFAGTEFRMFRMNRASENENVIEFTLTTESTG